MGRRKVFPLQISVKADALQENDAQNLVRLTQHALDDHNDFSGHHLRLQLAPKESSTDDDSHVALTIQLTPGESNSASLDSDSAVLNIAYPPNTVPSSSSSSSTLATYIANELQSTFVEEQSIISYLLSTSSAPDAKPPRPKPRDGRPTIEANHTIPAICADAAIEEYMKPMLDILGPIHNFTIDTQVQLYATPGAQSQVLSKDDLASFINAAEWPLSPSIGGAPTVNFVIYVGDQKIGLDSEAGTSSQSWMFPQWGSVYLLKLPETTAHVSAETLKQPMLTFNGHLLSLLGTPQSGSLPLRLSTLSRIRSADLLLQASSTLGSLARLSLALPSIAIPRSVADGVASTMEHLQQACSNLGDPSGLLHARIAEEEAERAFFEKSMVGQLYFPDEHKIAVYLPLLGPVGVPLVMGLVNELRGWIRRRRQRAKDAGEKKTQ
ncbi:GPI transamidase component [Fusarium falciforme]|nr:GPI transamidase component [Fusarium falciforme]